MIRPTVLAVALSALLFACRSAPQANPASPVAAAPSAPAAPALKQMKVNGVGLAYVEQGAGTPVVLVHGTLGDWRTLDALRPAVAKRWRYVAYSRRYHQPNPWPGDASDYSYQLHEADLVAFIQGLGAGPVHLVGHSYGAVVVLLVAMDHPELLKTAVIAEPPAGELIADRPGAGPLVAERSRVQAEALAAARSGDDRRAAEVFIDWVAGTPGAFWKLTEDRRRRFLENVRTIGPQMAQPPPPPITCPLVGAVRIPVLVIRGERTTRYYNAVTDALLSCLPSGTERSVIPAAGHASYAANPAAFTESVLGFLAGHP